MSCIVLDDDSSDDSRTVSSGNDDREPGKSSNGHELLTRPASTDEASCDDNMTEDSTDKKSNDDEDQPLLNLMKQLINYEGKQNSRLSNSQLIDILRKEFSLDITNLHFLSLDIYTNVLKNFLKHWPQWDEFDCIMHESRCMEDKNEVEKILEREYKSLKDYLAAILKASQPFAQEAAQKLKRSLEIPESSRAEPGDVILEINCTRDQLNTLFFRKPHPEYKSTIFNINDFIPSKINLKPLPFESMLNSCYVNVTVTLPCFHYKRQLMHNFKHTLVNKKLQRMKREPRLNKHLQCPKTMKTDGRPVKKTDLKEMINKICRANQYSETKQPDIHALLKIIEKDVDILTHNDIKLQIPCTFRYYLSSYPYVRYLYEEVDAESEKYDLQLEEKISPLLKLFIGRLNIYMNAVTVENWVKLECVICGVEYTGLIGIENLKAHFREVHQNEPDWTCTHCDRKFCAIELSTARWHHTCDVDTENSSS